MAPKALASATSSPVTAGAFQDPFGNLLANGRVTLDLSQSAAITGGGEVAPVRVIVNLDSSAKVAANQSIWANDQLTPSGTTYLMQLFDGSGNFAGSWGNQTIAGTAPIDLAILIPNLISSGGASSGTGTIALKPAANDHIQYVSPNGVDSNDGLSWGSAKLTVAAALSALGTNTAVIYESPALSTSDGIAASGSATGLNGYIWAPTKFYVGPLGQATSGTTGFDSRRIHLVGSVWNGSANVDDFWDIYVNSFPGAFSSGSNLFITHSSVESGAGRILFDSDVVVNNPRAATASLNSNSFSFDNQGAYFEGSSQNMLWEMANTVNQNGGALNTTIFRQNFVPIFGSAAAGAQAEFALGGSGALGVSGNYSGQPKWLFTNLRGSSLFTGTFEHSNTVNRVYTFQDSTDTIVGRATTDTLTNKTVGAGGLAGLNENKQVFSGNGTFTIPAGIVSVKVTVVGAGGGGISETPNGQAGGGGGAGGASIKWLTSLTPGNTLTVTVGTGGGANSAGGNSSVASGSQVISTITANGGAQGAAAGGAGGTASGGDLNFSGNTGGGTLGSAPAGWGAGSIFGGSTTQNIANGTPGAAGGAAGAGGGGAIGNGSLQAGGSGANGVVIFEWVN